MTELAKNYRFSMTAVPSKSVRPVVILLQKFAACFCFKDFISGIVTIYLAKVSVKEILLVKT